MGINRLAVSASELTESLVLHEVSQQSMWLVLRLWNANVRGHTFAHKRKVVTGVSSKREAWLARGWFAYLRRAVLTGRRAVVTGRRAVVAGRRAVLAVVAGRRAVLAVLTGRLADRLVQRVDCERPRVTMRVIEQHITWSTLFANVWAASAAASAATARRVASATAAFARRVSSSARLLASELAAATASSWSRLAAAMISASFLAAAASARRVASLAAVAAACFVRRSASAFASLSRLSCATSSAFAFSLSRLSCATSAFIFFDYFVQQMNGKCPVTINAINHITHLFARFRFFAASLLRRRCRHPGCCQHRRTCQLLFLWTRRLAATAVVVNVVVLAGAQALALGPHGRRRSR